MTLSAGVQLKDRIELTWAHNLSCDPFGSSRDVLKQIAKTEKSELKGSYSIDLSTR
jgi:hypothetical protein